MVWKKKRKFKLTNIRTTCMCAQLAARALKSTHVVRTRFRQLSHSHGAWLVLAHYFEKKKNVLGAVSLFRKEG